MYQHFFHEFLTGSDTLRVYQGSQLIFTSNKDGLLPLLDYINGVASRYQQVVIFDKIMGNAAASLSIKAGCREVYSPLGSQLAVKTLNKYGVKYLLINIVPYIQKPGSEDMCPMEKLSIDKTPEEFYEVVKSISHV